MTYILSLDQGTTSSRAVLFDAEGTIQAMAQREFTQHFPLPGQVEHRPEEIWTSQYEVALEAMQKLKVTASDIAAIGISNQRETTLIWDRKSGKPIYPAIVWQDRRTAPLCKKLKSAGHGPLFNQRTGLVLDPYFSGTKIAWILDHVKGARARAEAGELAFGTVDTWLVWKLTGGKVHVTDVTNASRTLLFNIQRRQWDEKLLEILDVPQSLLPKVCSSSETYGEARVKGLHGVPIAGIAGDQQAALFGQACVHHGMAKTTYGTGCFLLLNTGTQPIRSKNHLLTTMACEVKGKVQYALEGSVFIGGAVVQWLRDKLGIIKESSEVQKLAASVNDNDGVYFVPAFTGLGAPYWDPHARGAIFGLTRRCTAAHIARAAIESTAFQVAEVLHAMEADTGERLTQLRADGGATGDHFLMQFQADLLGVPVTRPTVMEVTALGAAYLAGLAVGYWPSLASIESNWRAAETNQPKMSRKEAATRLEKWNEAVECARNWQVDD